MYILGLNAYHGDSSACLVRDGRLVAAAEEERFRRVKHWAGFPSESIRYCLEEAGISLADVGCVAVNSDSRASLLKKIRYALLRKPDLGFVLDRIRNRRKRGDVAGELAKAFPGGRFQGRVMPVEHHLAHLVSAHVVSPFAESVCVSVDGFGDFSSAAWGVGRGGEIEVTHRVHFPHSLGIFYQAITQFIGFPHYGDEYKVMGLAPYGRPAFLRQMHELVRLGRDGTFALDLRYFLHHREGVSYRWEGGVPVVGRLYSNELETLLGFPARGKDEPLKDCHRDLAHSAQAMYEEAFFNILATAHARHPVEALTLAGGCGMNSVANGKVYRRSPFKRMYIQSAAGDAGGAIGAAFYAWLELGAGPRPASGRQSSDSASAAGGKFVMDHAYWGPEFSNAEIKAVLGRQAEELEAAGCEVELIRDEGELCRKTAAAVAEGKVIGWFQGRMEWGPRALGNRSIVCDPRRPDMKDILNLKIKRRESFRPFAPSILREQVSDWFEEEDDVPFMMQVFQIREEKRSVIPAVTHVDGSGRLQTVHRQTNPRYYRLIEAFRDITGVPVVLNTSFNENEPVVCRPEEALSCFLRTKMDVLVLGDYFLTRRSGGRP
ncbi:MAG TPA: carbamoyltransferase [Desulfobulbaceae bacterium]|nr:carbamoyltransferase [Desulfobulbaceae bacterium]